MDIVRLKEVIETSYTYAEVQKKLGYYSKGGKVYLIIRGLIEKHKLDISHFKGKGHGTSNNSKFTLEEILVEDSKYCNISSLKRRILKEGKLEYECNKCKINSWNNQPITLQLDHINGINNDHRLENLRFLCPNCHLQTPTFSGGNVRKIRSDCSREKV